MADTIDDLRAELAAAGIDPSQVQRGTDVTSWDEGTYVCEATDGGVVLRQLGRTRDDDRVEELGSESAVVIELPQAPPAADAHDRRRRAGRHPGAHAGARGGDARPPRGPT